MCFYSLDLSPLLLRLQAQVFSQTVCHQAHIIIRLQVHLRQRWKLPIMVEEELLLCHHPAHQRHQRRIMAPPSLGHQHQDRTILHQCPYQQARPHQVEARILIIRLQCRHHQVEDHTIIRLQCPCQQAHHHQVEAQLLQQARQANPALIVRHILHQTHCLPLRFALKDIFIVFIHFNDLPML